MGVVLAVVLGLLLCRRRLRLGRIVIASSLCALLLLSTPWMANLLMRNIEIYGPIRSNIVRGAQAIVVLGAGTSHEAPELGGLYAIGRNGLARVRYAAYLHRQSGLPILAAGGAPQGGRSEAETIREVFEEDFHVAVRWLETNSRNTVENAKYSSEILGKSGISTIVLVTDAIHMPRAKLLFEKNGIVVLPAPTGFATSSSEFDTFLILPSASALAQSTYAITEWLALSYVRIH